jgi:branched-chain amino acid transport system permease protein
MGCIYALAAIGFSMVYRTMNLVNFAQGDIMMVGAFFGYSLLSELPGLPFGLVLILAAAATGVLGFVLERVALRPAMRRQAGPIYVVLLTLGIGIVLSNLARVVWGANPVTYPTPLTHATISIGNYPLPAVYLWIFATMAVLLAGLRFFFHHTWLGIALRAVADDPDTARIQGVDAGKAAAMSFAFASAIAAAGGVLYAPIFYVSFDMGLIGLKAFAAAVLGSLGSIPGALLGGLIVGIGESVGGQLISTEYQDSIAFGLMILILLVRPNGLLGRDGR